ncbi:MAG: T9SS type A sorting domain-containing protein [Candidatus Sabulitectum sp.]|nr:T9SS type A sorting domain-containing protein [Candidatus Sabulitectum sp.]
MRNLIIIWSCALTAIAGNIKYEWSINLSDIQIDRCGEWDVLSFDGAVPVFPNGYPNLPAVSRCYVIPQGTSVTAVEISGIRTVSLGNGFLPAPVKIFPLTGDIPQNPDYTDVIFEELGLSFPSSPVAGYKTGSKTGFRVGSYSFVPFVYNQMSGELLLIVSAEISLVYQSDPVAPVYFLSEGQVELASAGLAAFIDNQDMLEIWSPSHRPDADNDIEVMVIGYSEHSDQLSELAALHNTLGYTAGTATVQWIDSNCEGFDTQERIRNHLKNLYENNGLLFAVICGDHGNTTRLSMLTNYSGQMNTTADLYYSDLDGTWDADGDHLYGELDDEIDYYSDIYAGRYPTGIEEGATLSVMIDKAVQYNTLPLMGEWRERVFLIGAVLFPQYPGNDWRFGSKHCDSIAEFIPDEWERVYFYEDTTGAHPDYATLVFNEGFAFVEYVAHGCIYGIMWYYPGDEFIMVLSSIGGMQNGGMLPWIHGSVSCSTGRLKHEEWQVEEGFAELIVQKSNGGAIVSVASSATAYGSFLDPGPSGWLSVYFSDLLFSEDLYPEAGVIHGVAKDVFWANWNTAWDPWVAQWVVQSLNLYGDPCTQFIPVAEGIEDDHASCFGISLTPNPVHGNCVSVHIELSLPTPVSLDFYDMSGRSVIQGAEQLLGAGENIINMDVSTLTGGMYFVKASAGDLLLTEKCVILH